MDQEKNEKDDQYNLIRIILIIILIAVSTFFIMEWISPDSKNLGKFLFGFGISFASIVVFAFCIKYVIDIYKQIKSKK